jgi:hypothetical protein
MNRERPLLEMWMVNIPDDRGHVRRCRMGGTWYWPGTYPSEPERQLHIQLRRAGNQTNRRAAVILGVMAAIVLIGITELIRQLNIEVDTWVAILAAMPLVWLLWDLLLLGPQVRPAYRREHRRIAMAYNCCPWCMYNLAGQQPADDGCTVCPECGGAWRMSAAGQPASAA